MKAVGFERFGGPEVLHVVDRPTPHAGPGEVRIRVRAAAVNPVDTLIRVGRSPIRPPGTEAVVPGLDVAGVVDEVGPGTASGPAVGDRVMAMVNPTRAEGGGYAEWVVLPEAYVAPAPAGTSHAEAATLPLNGLTALHALDLLALAPRSTLAVTGAAGAVGGYALQLARAAGHRVLADAAPQDAELVARLGADEVVARGTEVADRFLALAPAGADAVVDAAVIGTPLLRAVRRGGGFAGVREPADPAEFAAAARRAGVRVVTAFVHDYDGRRDKLDALRHLADSGSLTLRVARTFAKEEAAAAHRLLERGGVRGRIVLAF